MRAVLLALFVLLPTVLRAQSLPFTVADINPGPQESFLQGFTPAGARVYFQAYRPDVGSELWTSDGTVEGTHLVKDFAPGPASSGAFPLVADGSVLYLGVPGTGGHDLWRTDGTEAGTVFVKAFEEIAGGPVVVQGQLYFGARAGAAGTELWTSDGTPGGTRLVRDLLPGPSSSTPVGLFALGRRLYFRATTLAEGQELWTSDGTEAGTHLVKDLEPGPDGTLPTSFRALGSTAYFLAWTRATGGALWRTDGTATGTTLVHTGGPYGLVSTGTRLFFSKASTGFDPTGRPLPPELWTSDGTPDGTVKLPGPGWEPTNDVRLAPRSIGPVLYYAANDGVHGTELWRSDGTGPGTWLVADFIDGPFSTNPYGLTPAGATLYFATSGSLYRTDGTPSGTGRVFLDPPLPSGSAVEPVLAGTRLFLVARTLETGRELGWLNDPVLDASTSAALTLAPHPATTATRVLLPPGTTGDVRAVLYNVRGQALGTVFEGAATSGFDVPTASLAAGVYVLRVTLPDAVLTRRLVVVH